MQTIVIVFVTSFFATLLSSMSGGGSSAIALPVFLSLGLSFPLSSVILKISATFWAPIAAYNYLKGRRIEWKFLLLFAAIGLLGAYLGVLAITEINEVLLKRFVGILILVLVVYVSSQRKLGLHEKPVPSTMRKLAAYPFAILLGFYESILGAANGLLFAVVSTKTRGFDFIDAVGHYNIIACFWVLFATVLLLRQGIYDVPLMASGIVGSIMGAYIGSSFARLKGNAFIKAIFAVVGAFLAVKLIFNL